MTDIWRFSLPEEFLLLSHHSYGGLPDPQKTGAGCAAAELAELALHRRLRVTPEKKRRMLGFDFHSPPNSVHLTDPTPTGLAWADDLLEELGYLTASQGNGIHLDTWLRMRLHTSLSLHREALIERIGPFPTVKHKNRYPHSHVCDVLITWLRDAAEEWFSIDERTLFLSDLADGAGLSQEFGAALTIFQRINRARGTGAVAAVPEYLRVTSMILSGSIGPFDTSKYYDRRRGGGGVGGGDGGGDGGGGGE